MKTVHIEIDGKVYSGESPFSWSLHHFLQEMGLSPVPEVLRGADGKLVSPRYCLARQHDGSKLARCEVAEPTPALTAEEVLLTTGTF